MSDSGFRFESVVSRLARALAAGLPGRSAQETMIPRMPGGGPLHARRDPGPGALCAAGLVLVYPRADRPFILLVVRRADLPAHPGQVGLPAGMQDPGESMLATALRETEEEAGVPAAGLRVLGPLTPVFIPPTGILLHPFVAAASAEPDFEPHPAEVARLLEIPVEELLDPAALRTESRSIAETEAIVPYFRLQGEKIWGATGMILAEFRALLAGAPPITPP